MITGSWDGVYCPRGSRCLSFVDLSVLFQDYGRSPFTLSLGIHGLTRFWVVSPTSTSLWEGMKLSFQDLKFGIQRSWAVWTIWSTAWQRETPVPSNIFFGKLWIAKTNSFTSSKATVRLALILSADVRPISKSLGIAEKKRRGILADMTSSIFLSAIRIVSRSIWKLTAWIWYPESWNLEGVLMRRFFSYINDVAKIRLGRSSVRQERKE